MEQVSDDVNFSARCSDIGTETATKTERHVS